VQTLFKTQNDCSKDALVVGKVNNKTDHFVTSGNAILRSEEKNICTGLEHYFVKILPMNK
jgi:hypothetical protein